MKTANNLKDQKKGVAQPNPHTPGVTKGMVRQHAFELYRDRLDRGELSLNDWVLAEKDLVQQQEAQAG
jgi:hypothetical protein